MIKKNRGILHVLFSLSLLIFLAGFTFMGSVHSASAKTIIKDNAGLLTGSQIQVLKSACDDVLKDDATSIYIWTDSAISRSSDFGGAMENFVAQAGDKDVVILLIGMCPGDRVYEVQGYGKGQDYVTNGRCEHILDDMEVNMKDGNYYDAMQTFVSKTHTYMEKDPKFDSIAFSPLVHLLLALLIAGAIIWTMIRNSGGKMTATGKTYMDKEMSHLIGHFDRYTHTTVTRHAKPKNNSSGGGGGGGGHSSGGGRGF